MLSNADKGDGILRKLQRLLREVLRRFDAPTLVDEAAWFTVYAIVSQQRHLPAPEILRPILDLLGFAHLQPPAPASQVTLPFSEQILFCPKNPTGLNQSSL